MALSTGQLSHSNMTTGQAIALTESCGFWIFVGKVMPLLINKMSRLIIALLPRSKSLLNLLRFTLRDNISSMFYVFLRMMVFCYFDWRIIAL